MLTKKTQTQNCNFLYTDFMCQLSDVIYCNADLQTVDSHTLLMEMINLKSKFVWCFLFLAHFFVASYTEYDKMVLTRLFSASLSWYSLCYVVTLALQTVLCQIKLLKATTILSRERGEIQFFFTGA